LKYGGNQELHRRAGTENIPGIVGLAKALQMARKHTKKESKRLEDLVQYFWKLLQLHFPSVILNGPSIGINRLPGTINVCLKGVEAEQVLIYLDKRGVMCSTGSACDLQGVDTSHVLKSIGLSVEEARSSLRFSFGQGTKKTDIEYIIKQLVSVMKLLTS
jgi:cysteine desulfurase